MLFHRQKTTCCQLPTNWSHIFYSQNFLKNKFHLTVDRKFLTLDSHKSHFKAFMNCRGWKGGRPFFPVDTLWPASRSMLGWLRGDPMTFQRQKKLIPPAKKKRIRQANDPQLVFVVQWCFFWCWVTSTPKSAAQKWWGTKYSTQLVFQPEWKERNILVGGWTTQLKHMRGQIRSFPKVKIKIPLKSHHIPLY